MAVSLDAPERRNAPLDYTPAASASRRIVQTCYPDRWPEKALLNVNVPYLSESDLKGFRVSRMGQRIYRDELIRREDPRGKPYYWIGGEPPTGVDPSGTDFGDLAAGFVSITPIQLDLTDWDALKDLSSLTWK